LLKFSGVWLAAGFLFFTPLYSQTDPAWRSSDPDTSLAHFPTKLADDLPHLFISDNVPVFLTGGTLTALDWSTLDGQNSLASDLQHWNSQPLFDFGNFYGEGWVEGFGAVGSWSIGAWVKDERMQEFGRDASESLLLSTVLVTGLKYSINRTRPDGGSYSFPSGHTITAFCVGPVVTKYWGWEAGIPAYVLAAVTGLARVEGNHHYLSDVLAGATLGIVIGNAVVYKPKDVSVSVGPGRMDLKLAFN
jgi:membrane-associated phospholipid phosphatase